MDKKIQLNNSELSDYVLHNMTTLKAKEFLETRDEELKNFTIVTIPVSEDEEDTEILQIALENMAIKAKELGCKYVTDIKPVGYSAKDYGLKGFFFLCFGLMGSAEFYQQLHIVGTGLVEKKKE